MSASCRIGLRDEISLCDLLEEQGSRMRSKLVERRGRLEQLLKGNAFTIKKSFDAPRWPLSGVWIDQEKRSEGFMKGGIAGLKFGGFPRTAVYDPADFIGRDKLTGEECEKELEQYWKNRPAKRAIALYNMAVGSQQMVLVPEWGDSST